MRLTGKLLVDTETGRQYACKECLNTNHLDSCVILEGIDTVYHRPLYKVQDAVDDDDFEIERELHNSGKFEHRKTMVDEDVVP